MLYKRSKNNSIHVWHIEIEGSKYRTIEGVLDGKMTTSSWTICKGKNLNKKNETTDLQQTVIEIGSKIKSKLNSGYCFNIEDIDNAKSELISPMLAVKYDYYNKTLDNYYHSQPKLDGIRLCVNKRGKFSRGGKHIYSVEHFNNELSVLFETFGDDIMIDGEIYNHALKDDFNRIVSYTKKQKLTDTEKKESIQYLQYHIYDIQFTNDLDMTFKDRILKLTELFEINNFEYLKLVPTHPVENNDMLNYYYECYLNEGYEGQMIRVSNSKYENSRCKSLIKRKEFIDEEFTIIDITEGVGNRSGMMGRVHLIDGDGITFEANCRGNVDYYKSLLNNKVFYIGKKATVRYQNKTPDNNYRFPVVINIDRYEYE